MDYIILACIVRRDAMAPITFEESPRRHQGAAYIKKHTSRVAAHHACHTKVENIVKDQSSIHTICLFEDDNKARSSWIFKSQVA